MWTADRGRRRASLGTAGFTIIELAVAITLLVAISTFLVASIYQTQRTDRHMAAVEVAMERGQRIAYEVRNLVSTCRQVFDNDELGVGAGYLAALDLSRDPLAPGSRLPVIEMEQAMGTDVAGFPRTGNVLLFVPEGNDVPCVSDPDAGEFRTIDVCRFVCIYPSQTTRTLVRGQPPARDLVVWRSQAYPNLVQIMEIESNDERRSVLKDLYNRHGYRYAWDTTKPVADAFYAFDATGTLAAMPVMGMVIEEDAGVSDRGRLVYANVQLARSDPASVALRPVLTADDPAVWAPDGFEVKVSGPGILKQAWIRLVVEAPSGGQQGSAVHASTFLANVRRF